ncbi:MAG TPA: hypothetical protein DEA90_06185 [Opitutae bacterium]|nr:hypothetical protein [Puniceicoccaceae bacterium]HBR93735.1 hypothetical protein [Opitutae bacterium]|tara:strand:- start:49 stop:237 length:189 start_codon:yes stop_codon:yes gene_type:complete
MKKLTFCAITVALLLPTICSAGESSKGTVIMISGVSSWLVLSSGVMLWKEIKRSRGSNKEDK